MDGQNDPDRGIVLFNYSRWREILSEAPEEHLHFVDFARDYLSGNLEEFALFLDPGLSRS